ncbi:MAG: TlpA family protein disulfide reductase [Nitrospirae bacterium]|nr:TlpA family protein disulfide reductase [Nitrospirota bacterium]
MPSLENLLRQFNGEQLVLLGINVREDRDTVLQFVRDQGLSYDNLPDESGEVSEMYGVSSTPMKMLLDAEGNVIGAALGYREWDSDEVKELLRLLMKTT